MDEVEALKTCRKCGVDKELEQFYKNQRYGTGYTARCKKCVLTSQKTYARTLTATQSNRRYLLRKRYGLTPERFAKMVSDQGGKCANPGCTSFGTHVDHDHSTGQVRALLCSGCNLAFGNLYENVDKILGLAEYAKRFKA